MQTAVGNVWNPLPAWRFPGPLDQAIAPTNSSTNRGVFDAVGVPWAFQLDFRERGEIFDDEFGEPSGIVIRVMQPNGTSGAAINAARQSVRDLLGDVEGDRVFFNWWNNQYATQRNATFSSGGFFQRSAQVHPLWIGGGWILQANAEVPPTPIPPDPVPDPYTYPPGNNLIRWSLYPESVDGEPDVSYPLYQSDNGANDVNGFPGDLYRGRVFPFPAIELFGRTEKNYASRVICRPVLI